MTADRAERAEAMEAARRAMALIAAAYAMKGLPAENITETAEHFLQWIEKPKQAGERR